jgi:hypothetical protein
MLFNRLPVNILPGAFLFCSSCIFFKTPFAEKEKKFEGIIIRFQLIKQYSGKNLSSKHQSIRKSSAEGEALVVNAFYFSATHV